MYINNVIHSKTSPLTYLFNKVNNTNLQPNEYTPNTINEIRYEGLLGHLNLKDNDISI